jgi:broad specificity phosphatase PhoE
MIFESPSIILRKQHSGVEEKSPLDLTLFLIRHGEASHNVLEKMAKEEALQQALSEGLKADDDLTKERMELARQRVLLDDNLFDAPLSDLGKEEASRARDALASLSNAQNLPFPEEILVSPLTRTLETANLVFPYHANVHVREELRERCTGKPPDTRSPTDQLRSRISFSRFSMDRLEEMAESAALHHSQQHWEKQKKEENKSMLRERTRQLFRLLAECPPTQKSIAVVTHKAYLRELERGPFGNPESPEFKNGEIRVYKIRLHPETKFIEHAERIV